MPEGASLAVHSELQFPGSLVDFAAALGSGILFPQWSVFARNGFGSPYLGYYQPGFNYLASVCLWLTGDPNAAIALACTLLALSGAAGMFLLARHLMAGVAPKPHGPVSKVVPGFTPFVAAILFLCHPYLTINLFRRGDFSEYACAMVVPMALYWAFRQRDPGNASNSGLLAASVCLAACVIFHPLLSYPLFIALAILSRRLWTALGAASLLSAFYWLPLLTELKFVRIDRAFNPALLPDNHMLHPGHVLLLGPDVEAPFNYHPNWMLVALAIAGLIPIMMRGNPVRRLSMVAAASTAGLVFMMTKPSLFVWEWFPLLEKLQFPWRLQNFAAISIAILATCGVLAVPPRSRFTAGAVTLATMIAAMWPLSLNVLEVRQAKPVRTPTDLIETGFNADPFDEWLPKTATTRNPPRGATARVSGPCVAGPVQRDPGVLRLAITWNPVADRQCEIIVPHYFYPVGWRAGVTGAGTRSPVTIRNFEGFQMVQLSPDSGASGSTQVLEFHSEMSMYRMLGLALSVLTALILSGIALRPSWIKQV